MPFSAVPLGCVWNLLAPFPLPSFDLVLKQFNFVDKVVRILQLLVLAIENLLESITGEQIRLRPVQVKIIRNIVRHKLDQLIDLLELLIRHIDVF